MSVWTDLDNIDNNPSLTPEQKRTARYQVKCDALQSLLQGNSFRNKPFVFEGVTITIHSAAVQTPGGVPTLRVEMTAVRVLDGLTLISRDNIQFIVNPPVLTRQRAQDLAQVGRELLRGLIR